jgi:cysteine desulfurase
VALLTRNFTSETPLDGAVIEAISTALADGWANPQKLSQAANRASRLREASLAQLGELLGQSPNAIEPVGEPNLLHHLAISGFLTESSHLITSEIDLGKIRAIAHQYSGAKSTLKSNPSGEMQLPMSFADYAKGADIVLSLQMRNGEVGCDQDIPAILDLLDSSANDSRVILDGTKAIPQLLDSRISAATFDSSSWQGPSGLGFLVINQPEKYRYPLAHLSAIRTPGSYSLPLLVGSIVALELYKERSSNIAALRKLAISELSKIPAITVVGATGESDARYLSLIVDGYAAQELLPALAKSDIFIDAGSACSPDYLSPSYVIKSLGYMSEGHLRITLNCEHTEDDVYSLAIAIARTIELL